MRIALLCPYSWTYPGGVSRHIEALAQEYQRRGHYVRVLAPVDPADQLSARLHRGVTPQPRELPEWLIPLGRTVGINSNGSVSSISISPAAAMKTRQVIAESNFDVAHIHEPLVPLVGWDTLSSAKLPMVGTFHAYSTNWTGHKIGNSLGFRRLHNRLHRSIAVSEAASWTARRYFGGSYRIIPNGVHLHEDTQVQPQPLPIGNGFNHERPLQLLFLGQAVTRKGLPILLRAFEALREHVPVKLTVIGSTVEEISPLIVDFTNIEVLGRVDDKEKFRQLAMADLLCAPSLGGESFGMVLTEAFAAGTAVVASNIAGYRDVLADGKEGLLVPRGDAKELAERLHDLADRPEWIAELSANARIRAERFAWPHVADEIMEVYEEAVSIPVPDDLLQSAARRIGAIPADGSRKIKPKRLESIEPPLDDGRSPKIRLLRRVGFAAVTVVGLILAVLALRRIGIDNIITSLLDSRPSWLLAGLALMCGSMVIRAIAWYAILRAALPESNLKLGDAMQGTFIGVLMSATLPARLGEPSRALIVARRSGKPRENLPAVLGTVVSQALLNILALVVLGVVMFKTVGLFTGHETALVAVAVGPVVLALLVVLIPALLSRSSAQRSKRIHAIIDQVHGAFGRLREGLHVFKHVKLGFYAATAQLVAWTVQWLACYLLLVALDLHTQAGLGAAAAVLFAVNVTAVLPLTPSNLGVFQAACVAVLTAGTSISSADALGYGVILQAVEIATAILMGVPALLREGVSWKDVRLRAMHTTPVEISPRVG